MMIVMPLLVGLIALAVILLTLFRLFGVSYFDLLRESEHLGKIVEQVQIFSGEWSPGAGSDIIQEDMDRINITLKDKNYSNISLAVFHDGERLYTAGDYVDTPFLSNALSQPGNNQYLMNRIYTYTADAGEYKIILTDTNFWFHGETYNISHWIYIERFLELVFALIVIVIFITTRILSRKIFKSIMTPLNTLVYGVRQIRDGNLNYRIEYNGKDEFSAVCADFNEMAKRLLDMVNTKQKYEENRKELIAGISHDLRTSLTSILTYVEGIEIGLASTPKIQQHYFDTIKNKAKDLEHIVSQLFLLAKLDVEEFPMYMSRVDIGCWLTDFMDTVSEEYRQKGLHIDFTENVQDVEVKVNSVQLGNVLINIIENSLKYVDKEQKRTHVICRADNKNTVITLSDNGPGVPGDALEKLFHMFYRSDKARRDVSQGSGLGLAISAKIIERFEGTIKAENSTDGGLSVVITLPIVKGADA